LLIADEPTTALDVTIQAQILDLMVKLKEESDTAIMLITHNLGVVAQMAQRILVMYAGRVVEEAPVYELFDHPLHPYTQGLLRSIPKLEQIRSKEKVRLQEIPGLVPSLSRLPKGCSFNPRCHSAMTVCREQPPPLVEAGQKHLVRCWLREKGDL